MNQKKTPPKPVDNEHVWNVDLRGPGYAVKADVSVTTEKLVEALENYFPGITEVYQRSLSPEGEVSTM